MTLRDGESLVFGIDLQIPERIRVSGREWFSRPEFHVTTFTPDDLAAAFELELDTLVRAGEEHEAELTRQRSIHFDGRVAELQADDGRRTLVAFCDVDGLDAVYGRLSAAVGRELPPPPTHVTLYTSEPEMKGIGLSTQAQVAQRATPLADSDAATVLAHVPDTVG